MMYTHVTHSCSCMVHLAALESINKIFTCKKCNILIGYSLAADEDRTSFGGFSLSLFSRILNRAWLTSSE